MSNEVTNPLFGSGTAKQVTSPLFDIGMDSCCAQCGRWTESTNPFAPTWGNGKEKILIVIDELSYGDDRSGKVLSGDRGAVLKKMLQDFGYDLGRDFWITAAIKCYSDKKPTAAHVQLCREKLYAEIARLDPKAVFLFGSNAVKAMMGQALKESNAATLAGTRINFRGVWACTFESLSMYQMRVKEKNQTSFYRRALRESLEFVTDNPETPKPHSPYNHVIPVTDIEHFNAVFDMLEEYEGKLAIDYETTGVNPHVKGHKILAASVATDDETAYAFAVEYDGAWTEEEAKVVKSRMIDLYKKKEIDWVAANAQFEKKWTRAFFGEDVPFYWCTMLAAHLEDTRSGMTGLKLQAFIKWGVYGYDDESEKYIKSADGTPFNKMQEMPLDQMLIYVGCDAHLTMRLYKEQAVFHKDNIAGVLFFTKGGDAMAELSYNGINADMQYYSDESKKLTKTIDELELKMISSDEVQGFIREYKIKELNLNSTQQIKRLLIDHLGLSEWKQTATGLASMDKESMGKMTHWLPDTIIEMRKLKKLRDTYLAQFAREAVDGKLHPSYTLNIARSLRSSSLNPNFQNIPKHDKVSKKICRQGLKPTPGNMLCEIDFSGIEVSTSVLYHKDPNFLKYLEDPSSDMHRDNAADLWKTTPENVSGACRSFQKGTWTFPQFYGDYYGACAKGTWEGRHILLEDGMSCEESLKRAGIKNIDEFTEYLKEAERILWYERFPVYTAWKESVCEEFRQNGYIETFFGYRFSGNLDKKQITNFPIQSTAFHLNMWCLIYAIQIAKREGWRSKFIGQIHDSMILDLVPEEAEYILGVMKWICETVVVERFDWITTQFRIDMEVTKINGDFSSFYGIDLNSDGKLTISISKKDKLEIITPKDWQKWRIDYAN